MTCLFFVYRLFWPKSHSFDYLYEYGEILLQNFPVQATINLYEDLDTEEEEDEDAKEEHDEVKEDADKKAQKEVLRSNSHQHTNPQHIHLPCPN